MAFSKDQQIRLVIYSVVTLVVGFGGIIFYLGWKDTRFSVVATGASTVQVTKKYTGINVDASSVTSSPKFQELKAVVVPTGFGQESVTGTATSTPQDYFLTPEQLVKIPRRHYNPFKPF